MPDPDATTQTSAAISAEGIAWYAQRYITAHGPGNKNTLQKMVAIALAESGGNYRAHNPRPPDDSYGLWQINMYGTLGPLRRVQFGIKENKELFNPHVNARAANAILASQGFGAWSVYKNGSYRQHLPAAWRAINNPKRPINDSVPVVDLGDAADVVDENLGDLSGPLNPFDVLNALKDSILGYISEGVLRIAGFLGGAALIIIAVVIVAKRGIK